MWAEGARGQALITSVDRVRPVLSEKGREFKTWSLERTREFSSCPEGAGAAACGQGGADVRDEHCFSGGRGSRASGFLELLGKLGQCRSECASQAEPCQSRGFALHLHPISDRIQLLYRCHEVEDVAVEHTMVTVYFKDPPFGKHHGVPPTAPGARHKCGLATVNGMETLNDALCHPKRDAPAQYLCEVLVLRPFQAVADEVEDIPLPRAEVTGCLATQISIRKSAGSLLILVAALWTDGNGSLTRSKAKAARNLHRIPEQGEDLVDKASEFLTRGGLLGDCCCHVRSFLVRR